MDATDEANACAFHLGDVICRLASLLLERVEIRINTG